MSTVFFLLFLVSLVALFVGVIKPRVIFRKDYERIAKIGYRKYSTILFGFLALLFLVLSGITSEQSTPPPATQQPQQSEEGVPEATSAQESPSEPLQEQITQQEGLASTSETAEPQSDTYTVTYIVDGDTFEVESGERVRPIGIDSPERGQPYFAEARAKMTELVLNKEVRLEKDISEIDRWGRLLRYVYVGDLFVNLEMVRLGYANSYTYPPDVKYQDQILAAEQEARNAGIGLWKPTPTPSSSAPPSTTFTLPACYPNDCDCSDFSTHAHAQWFHENYDPNDTHRLDRDKDGLACESLP